MLMKLMAMPVLGAIALLAGCASVPDSVGAAQNPATVQMTHYGGTWLEIGRRPMAITNTCVAGYTTYRRAEKVGEIAVEDGCHMNNPGGKLKTIKGRGELLDAGTTNARLRVHYPFFITFDYWVLYEAPDHTWFISSDPSMTNLWIYARENPTENARLVMIEKAKALGYDTNLLEFPAQ